MLLYFLQELVVESVAELGVSAPGSLNGEGGSLLAVGQHLSESGGVFDVRFAGFQLSEAAAVTLEGIVDFSGELVLHSHAVLLVHHYNRHPQYI